MLQKRKGKKLSTRHLGMQSDIPKEIVGHGERSKAPETLQVVVGEGWKNMFKKRRQWPSVNCDIHQADL
ncbi:hypothetical protein J6590_038183, partial [Homalodisca vitripennis]